MDVQQRFFKNYLKKSAYEKEDGTPYTSDKVKGYKCGVLEESKNFMVLKHQAGYLSNQMCS